MVEELPVLVMSLAKCQQQAVPMNQWWDTLSLHRSGEEIGVVDGTKQIEKGIIHIELIQRLYISSMDLYQQVSLGKD